MKHLCSTTFLLTLFLGLAPMHLVAKPKVILIGVDGVSLNLLEPYAARGLTPNLKKLLDTGMRGDLDSIWPLRTPQVWTTVMTGKLPGQHGVWDHKTNSYFNPPEFRSKKEVRVTTAERKSKALWSILSEKNRKSLTVGWVPSWPAENVSPGVMVAPVELFGDRRQTTIKGSFWRDQKQLVWPKSLWPRVKKKIVEIEDLDESAWSMMADLPGPKDPIFKYPKVERYSYAVKWSAARARSVENITLDLLKTENPELLSLYFQCTDSLLHRFWIFQKGEKEVEFRLKTHGMSTAETKELTRRYKNVVDGCYQDVDARIGRILEAAQGPETVVLLVSDHGFGDAPRVHKLRGEPFSGDHKDQGIILAAGGGIKKSGRLAKSSVVDIAPTILWILGLPYGEDMIGRPLLDLFEPGALKNAGTIPSYENIPQLDVPYRAGYPNKK